MVSEIRQKYDKTVYFFYADRGIHLAIKKNPHDLFPWDPTDAGSHFFNPTFFAMALHIMKYCIFAWLLVITID